MLNKTIRTKIIFAIVSAIISSLITMAIYTGIERHRAIAEFGQYIYICQQSLLRTHNDMHAGRDFLHFSPKNTANHMNQSREHAQDIYQCESLDHIRQSLLYLEDLYRFILVDVLEDVELFDMCTGPFLKVDFSGDLWLYLDDLDSYLQTDNGAKAFATLSEYFGTNSDKSIVSYCCVRAKILKTTCIHSEKGTKLPKIKREISNTMPIWSSVEFGEWKHPVFSSEGYCKRKISVPSCVIKLTHQHLILSGRICNRLERQKRNTWLTKRDNHIVYKIWGRTFLLCRDIINDNVYMRTTGYAKTKML